MHLLLDTCSHIIASTVGPAYSAPANKGLLAYKALGTGSPQKFCSYFYSGNKAASLKGIILLGPFRCAIVKPNCMCRKEHAKPSLNLTEGPLVNGNGQKEPHVQFF